MRAPVKVISSCTRAQGAVSILGPAVRCAGESVGGQPQCRRREIRRWACYGGTEGARRVAYWVEVIATAATWHAEAGVAVGPVVAWLAGVILWRERRLSVEALIELADDCRRLPVWLLAAAIRTATREAWRWDRLCGRVSLRAAAPYGASGAVSIALGAAVLEDAAEGFGLTAEDARAEWREACARHHLEGGSW